MILEVVDHQDKDEWNDDEFIDMDLRAKILHSKGNENEGPNRHAIVMGEDVIVVETTE